LLAAFFLTHEKISVSNTTRAEGSQTVPFLHQGQGHHLEIELNPPSEYRKYKIASSLSRRE
jgi:hypothetical protein